MEKGHLALTLPARGTVAAVEHRAALPWQAAGVSMASLAAQSCVAAPALRFAILTAARTGEVWAQSGEGLILLASYGPSPLRA